MRGHCTFVAYVQLSIAGREHLTRERQCSVDNTKSCTIIPGQEGQTTIAYVALTEKKTEHTALSAVVQKESLQKACSQTEDEQTTL